MAYNVKKIEYLDGIQYRIYDNPITVKEYMSGEKGKIQSDRIDKKIKGHVKTPWGPYADEVDTIELLTLDELLARKKRSVVSATNRAKSMVFDYARSNVWDYFITLTFDIKKVDRYDYKSCSKAVRQWLNNIKKKYAPDLKYLLVPEMHTLKEHEERRAFHFHGLLANTGSIKFTRATNKHTGKPLFTKNGIEIYNFQGYKLGFSTATPIKDNARVSSYMTKYITKDLTMHTHGFRRYYPSCNLDLPRKIMLLFNK